MSEYPSYLIHYGIQGQKWGVRRFQNEDGTYTSEGLERRRQLIESGAPKSEIRKATREGNREVREIKKHKQYNKQLEKQQNFINKKFDKVTEKIKTDREAGLHPKDRDIRKAIKLGTEFRKRDYIAKDPDFYYKQSDHVNKVAKTTGFVAGFALGVPGIPVALGVTTLESIRADKKINKHYKDVFEKAKNETMEDLKKHKIIV